jgi:hypothetical protein
MCVARSAVRTPSLPERAPRLRRPALSSPEPAATTRTCGALSAPRGGRISSRSRTYFAAAGEARGVQAAPNAPGAPLRPGVRRPAGVAAAEGELDCRPGSTSSEPGHGLSHPPWAVGAGPRAAPGGEAVAIKSSPPGPGRHRQQLQPDRQIRARILPARTVGRLRSSLEHRGVPTVADRETARPPSPWLRTISLRRRNRQGASPWRRLTAGARRPRCGAERAPASCPRPAAASLTASSRSAADRMEPRGARGEDRQPVEGTDFCLGHPRARGAMPPLEPGARPPVVGKRDHRSSESETAGRRQVGMSTPRPGPALAALTTAAVGPAPCMHRAGGPRRRPSGARSTGRSTGGA